MIGMQKGPSDWSACCVSPGLSQRQVELRWCRSAPYESVNCFGCRSMFLSKQSLLWRSPSIKPCVAIDRQSHATRSRRCRIERAFPPIPSVRSLDVLPAVAPLRQHTIFTFHATAVCKADRAWKNHSRSVTYNQCKFPTVKRERVAVEVAIGGESTDHAALARRCWAKELNVRKAGVVVMEDLGEPPTLQ